MRETENVLSTQYLFGIQQRHGYMNLDNRAYTRMNAYTASDSLLLIKGIQKPWGLLSHVGNNHPNYIHTFLRDKNVKYSLISRSKRIPVYEEDLNDAFEKMYSLKS